MIVLCKDYYPGVLYITFEESVWSRQSIVDTFNEIIEMIKTRKDNEPQTILCFVGNAQVNTLPSISTYVFIAKQLLSMHSLLIENVARTAIFLPDLRCIMFWRILKLVMTMKKPQKFFDDLVEMEKWVADENAVVNEISLT